MHRLDALVDNQRKLSPGHRNDKFHDFIYPTIYSREISMVLSISDSQERVIRYKIFDWNVRI